MKENALNKLLCPISSPTLMPLSVHHPFIVHCLNVIQNHLKRLLRPRSDVKHYFTTTMVDAIINHFVSLMATILHFSQNTYNLRLQHNTRNPMVDIKSFKYDLLLPQSTVYCFVYLLYTDHK